MSLLFCVLFATLVGRCSAGTNADLERCICYNSTSETNCDGDFSHQCKDYMKAVGLSCWPSVLGLVLFIMVIPMVGVGMCFCRCCKPNPDEEGAPPLWHKLGFFFILMVMLLGGGLATAFAISNSETLSTGVDELSDIVDTLVRKAQSDTTAAATAYGGLPAGIMKPTIQAQLQSVSKKVDDQTKEINDAKSDVLDWDHGKWASRRTLTIGVTVASLITILLSFSAGLLRNKCFTYTVVFFLCLMGTISSIAALAYQTTEKVSDDVCHDYAAVTEITMNRATTELGCKPTSTDGLYEIVKAVTAAEAPVGTYIFDAVCKANVLFTCGSKPTTFDSMNAAITDVTVLPASAASPEVTACVAAGACTIKACSTLCTGNYKDKAAEVVAQAARFQDLKRIAASWGGCQEVAKSFADARKPLCDDVEPYADRIWIAVAFLLLAMFVTTVLLMAYSQGAKEARDQYTDIGHNGVC